MAAPTTDDLDQIEIAQRPGRVSPGFLVRAGLLLLAFASVGVYSYNRIFSPASLQGVVNAPLITLRAPIDGKLERGTAMVGQAIAPGANMFVVRDPRVDLHLEAQLRARLTEALQRVTAIDQTMARFDAMSEVLRHDTAAYSTSEQQRLEATVTGLDQVIADDWQTLQVAREREDRLEHEFKSGIVIEQRFDEAKGERLHAKEALDRAIADRGSNLAALDAAKRRIFVQSGFGGTAYAQQRQDEIQMREVELRYQRALAVSEAEGLRSQLDAETAHVDALREVAVPSSVGGVVAAVYVSPGTEVLRGNPLAEVLDCSSLYIEANFSPGWFAVPRVGDPVQIDLYGARTTVHGHIRALRDNAMALDPSRAIPLSERDRWQTLTAIIDIDPGDLAVARRGECPVGQPASVRFR